METTILDLVPGTDGSLAKIVDGRVIGCLYWNIDLVDESPLIYEKTTIESGGFISAYRRATLSSLGNTGREHKTTSEGNTSWRDFEATLDRFYLESGSFNVSGQNSKKMELGLNHLNLSDFDKPGSEADASGWWLNDAGGRVSFGKGQGNGIFLYGDPTSSSFHPLSQNNFGLHYNCRVISKEGASDPRWEGYPIWAKVYEGDVATKFTIDCSTKPGRGLESMGGVFSASTHLYTNDDYTDFTDIKYGYEVVHDYFVAKRGVIIATQSSGMDDGFTDEHAINPYVAAFMLVKNNNEYDVGFGMGFLISTFGDAIFTLDGGLSFDSAGVSGSGSYMTAAGGFGFSIVSRFNSHDFEMINGHVIETADGSTSPYDIDEGLATIGMNDVGRYQRSRVGVGKGTIISGSAMTRNSQGVAFARGTTSLLLNIEREYLYDNYASEKSYYRWARSSAAGAHNIAYTGVAKTVDEGNGLVGEYAIMGVVGFGAKSGYNYTEVSNTFIVAHENGYVFMDSGSSMKLAVGADDHFVASRKWVRTYAGASSINHGDLYGLATYSAGSGDSTYDNNHITSGAAAVIFGGGVSEGASGFNFTQSFIMHGKVGNTISSAGGISRSHPTQPGHIPFGIWKNSSGVDNLAIEWAHFYAVARKSYKSQEVSVNAVTGTPASCATISLGGYKSATGSDEVAGITTSAMIEITNTVASGGIKFAVLKVNELDMNGETYNIIIKSRGFEDTTVTVTGSFDQTWTGSTFIVKAGKTVVISGVCYDSPGGFGSRLILTKTETV